MGDEIAVQMSDEERIEFLGNGGTGVVSFAVGADEPPYTLPVSYGYDPESGEFYFRFGFDPDSGKHDAVREGRPVSFVASDHEGGRWRSVVASGRIEEVTDADIDSDAMAAMRRIHIPLVDTFDRRPDELAFRFFRLDADDVSGRKEARTEQ